MKNKAYSEFELIQGIDEIIQEAPSRLFLTQFSSNIHRMQTILNSCHKHGKKLIPVGRSMEFYLSTAEEVRILEVPPKTLKNIKEVEDKNHWGKPIVTKVSEASKFYSAEEYHQDYLQKNPNGYTCHFVRTWG